MRACVCARRRVFLCVCACARTHACVFVRVTKNIWMIGCWTTTLKNFFFQCYFPNLTLAQHIFFRFFFLFKIIDIGFTYGCNCLMTNLVPWWQTLAFERLKQERYKKYYYSLSSIDRKLCYFTTQSSSRLMSLCDRFTWVLKPFLKKVASSD